MNYTTLPKIIVEIIVLQISAPTGSDENDDHRAILVRGQSELITVYY
jgi:hypothetical protein